MAVIAALVLALATGVVAAQNSPGAQRPASYTVGPGDELAVVVQGDEDLTKTFRVGEDGTIGVPLLGRVPVAGLGAREIEALLRKRLTDGGFFVRPEVSVEVAKFGSRHVFVLGELKQSSRYTLEGPTTLFEILTRAGGLTDNAGDDVLVLRPTDPVAQGAGPLDPGNAANARRMTVDLAHYRAGNLSANMAVQHGDTIVVPAAGRVSINGEVKAPGFYPIRRATTVSDVITMAGGLTGRGTMSRIKIRREVKGKPQERGAKPTDKLQPGDVIVAQPRRF